MGNELEEETEYNEEAQPEVEQDTEEYDKVFFGADDEEVADETETEEVEEESEAPIEGEPEEESDPEEEVEEESKAEPEVEQVQRMETLKWRGKEIEVPYEEAIAMAQQNFDITHKYQEVAKLRKETESDLDLLKKVRDGDKEALAMLSQQSGIDPVDLLDIDVAELEQGTSKPEEPFVSEQVALMMDEVAKDDNLYNEMSDIEKMLPSSVVSKMAKDPETFYAIINEVRSGDASIVLPQLQAKLSQLDDLDRSVVMNDTDAFANFYVNVKNSLIQKANTPKQETPKKTTVNPAKVSVQKSNNRKRGDTGKLDAMSSDDAYEKILERLNSQQ